MTSLETAIQQQLQALNPTTSLLTPEDILRIHTKMQAWQDQLAQAGSSFRICWNFQPDLFAWMGPVASFVPQTLWLQQRLHHIPIWSIQREVASLGHKTSDTIVNTRFTPDDTLHPIASSTPNMGSTVIPTWEIYLRPSQYQAILECDLKNADPYFLHTLDLVGGTDCLLSYRQEVNLAHEWGHIVTDRQILYRDLLLDRLTLFSPPVAWQIMSWIRWILEGLAEWFPSEGSFGLLLFLSQDKTQDKLVRGLLCDRLRDLPRNGLDAFVPLLQPYVTPCSLSKASTDLWPSLAAWCQQTGQILCDLLWQSVNTIPTDPSKISTWQREHQQHGLSRIQAIPTNT